MQHTEHSATDRGQSPASLATTLRSVSPLPARPRHLATSAGSGRPRGIELLFCAGSFSPCIPHNWPVKRARKEWEHGEVALRSKHSTEYEAWKKGNRKSFPTQKGSMNYYELKIFGREYFSSVKVPVPEAFLWRNPWTSLEGEVWSGFPSSPKGRLWRGLRSPFFYSLWCITSFSGSVSCKKMPHEGKPAVCNEHGHNTNPNIPQGPEGTF